MADITTPEGLLLIPFGPDANCTLDLCPVQASVLGYRPSIPASAIFMALFAIALAIHVFLGVRWRSWGFMTFMVLGCVSEIIGYGGRIILYNNPFSFEGFLLQIILITSAPVFYTASIYITISQAINHFDRSLSRIPPQWLWWILVPADIICLVLQAAGGALTTVTKAGDDTGLIISQVGLIMQVVILALFILVFADYMIRYVRSPTSRRLTTRERMFFSGLATAITLILGRCAYRIEELSEGYDSPNFRMENLFYGLEGVMIAVAVFALCVGHPGLVFGRKQKDTDSDS